MKNVFYFLLVSLLLKMAPAFAHSDISSTLLEDSYTTSVTFPANFTVGDYIEFVKVSPCWRTRTPTGLRCAVNE